MKVLFTADIHIKLGQKNVPLEWAKNRYKLFNNALKELQKEADMVIVGGDTFDRVPTVEEIEVYVDLVRSFILPTIIIPGNHESIKKSTTFLTNLKNLTKAINPLVTIIDDFYSTDEIDFIPYNKLKEYHPADTDFHNNILVTHVRGEIPPHVKPEVPLGIFSRWEVVLAGDLHSYENSQSNILYPGSPMVTSFHRNIVDCGVIILDTNTLKYEFIKVDLPQLIRKTIQAGEPMPSTEYHHTIYQVEGDLSELSKVTNSDLIDKKVATKTSDVVLILDPEMTLTQELEEYLQFILGIEGSSLEELLKEFKQLEYKIND